MSKPKVELIAEVSSNAGGSLDRAKLFIERFAAVGADVLKFQLTRAKRLRLDDPQRAWFEKAEWSLRDMAAIAKLCIANHVLPLFTVYHPDDVIELRREIQFYRVKIGAGEAHSGKLAEAVLAHPFETIYVSEGIRPAHALYRNDPRVIMLGTCSRYPAPSGVVGHRYLTGAYQGWSDHAVGLDESVLAVILGATVIERHVQIKEQAREPRPFESTVEEFAELRRRVDEDPDRFLGRWNGDGV